MPNYVANVIKMKDIANLPLFIMADEEKRFDFNKLIPMPESLDMPSGSMTEQYIMYYLTERCTIPLDCLDEEKSAIIKATITNNFCNDWQQEIFNRVFKEAYKTSEFKRDQMYNDGKKYVDNYINHGAVTWYEWCCKNWGTKWNAGSTSIIDDDTISFTTAWSMPGPIIEKLSQTYPDTEIEIWWADEDQGSNTGHIVCKNNELISGGDHADGSDEAYRTYDFCWGNTVE